MTKYKEIAGAVEDLPGVFLHVLVRVVHEVEERHLEYVQGTPFFQPPPPILPTLTVDRNTSTIRVEIAHSNTSPG